MGTGIGLVASRVAGLQVHLCDTTEDKLSQSRKFAEKLLQKDVDRSKITSDARYEILGRMSYSLHPADFCNTDFLVEAVFEDLELKKSVLKTLDAVLPKESIIGSNTSSISITKLAACTSRPTQVIGMHFMNPVPVMKLVEIISGLQTSQETLDVTQSLCRQMGKTSISAQDYPGFILNRVLMPYINEAIFLVHEGVATVADIDNGLKLGANVPMGPLTLADFIGLDTCLGIMNVLHGDFKDSKYRPCPLLVNYVNAGRLGKKSGRGFYDYNK